MDLIIICGDEEELIDLASKLNQKECQGNAECRKYNDENIPMENINKLFLVGHANIQSLGDYQTPELFKKFGSQMNAANCIYLAGCSTDDSEQQILPKEGFIASTLGKDVKQKYQKKRVFATPTTLYLNSGQLEIATDHRKGITNKAEIWVEVV